MRKSRMPVLFMLLFLSISLLSGCSSSSDSGGVALAASSVSDELRLILVVAPDLTNNNGDINTTTANLTNQGLQRALKQATWMRTVLLKSQNVQGIYALEPATHLQTSAQYPDMVPLEIIEQFALLNTTTMNSVTAGSFPVGVSYSADSLPSTAPTPAHYPACCQGIDFADTKGDNETLVRNIISQNQSGAFVFSMPFCTFQTLLANLKKLNSYDYSVPAAPEGPNVLYVLTVSAGGTAALVPFDTHIMPGSAYPPVSPAWQNSPSSYQTPLTVQTAQVSGSSTPADINVNETVYFIRHGEAHPASVWEDGNLILQGGWRALYLPAALPSKIRTPDVIYACDPSQLVTASSTTYYSYVRPSQTVAPYAIAGGIPLRIASTFLCAVPGVTAESQSAVTLEAAKFFFTGGQFSNKTLLVDWEHAHIPLIAQSLINLYFTGTSSAPQIPSRIWPGDDYDTIWTFSLDDKGNLTLSNLTCEGINSATLPSVAPSLTF